MTVCASKEDHGKIEGRIMVYAVNAQVILQLKSVNQHLRKSIVTKLSEYQILHAKMNDLPLTSYT